MSRDAWLTIWISKDRQHSYNAASEHYLGDEGDYHVAAERLRAGVCREATARFRFTSPCTFNVTCMQVKISGEGQ